KFSTGEMEDQADNLYTALSAGSGAPDIAMIDQTMVDKFLQAKDKFYDMNDLGFDEIADRYVDQKLELSSSPDGEFVLGVPMDIGPEAMFYRTDIFEKADLPTDPDDVADVINDWDAYESAAEKIYDATEKPIADSGELLFNALRDQSDKGYFDEDNNLI